MPNLTATREALVEAGIPFREEQFLSRFWGTRIIIALRKDAIKAEKLFTPGLGFTRYHSGWAIVFF